MNPKRSQVPQPVGQPQTGKRSHKLRILAAALLPVFLGDIFSGWRERAYSQEPIRTITTLGQPTKSTGPGRIPAPFLRTRLFISGNGETLITGVGTPKWVVTAWDTRTWNRLASFDIGDAVLVAATSDADMIATSEIDKTTVIVRNAMTGDHIRSLMVGPAPQAHPTKTFTAAAFSSKTLQLVTVPFSQRVSASLWDVSTGHERGTFAHSCRGEGIVFSRDDLQLAVWGWFPEGSRRPHMAEIWKVDPPMLQSRIVEDDRLTSLAFAPDGARVATGNSRGLVGVWEAAGGRKLFDFEAHGDQQFLQVTYSPVGGLIATGGSDGTVKLWDSMNGRHISTFTHSEPVDAVAFFPDGKQIAAADPYGVIKIWEVP